MRTLRTHRPTLATTRTISGSWACRNALADEASSVHAGLQVEAVGPLHREEVPLDAEELQREAGERERRAPSRGSRYPSSPSGRSAPPRRQAAIRPSRPPIAKAISVAMPTSASENGSVFSIVEADARGAEPEVAGGDLPEEPRRSRPRTALSAAAHAGCPRQASRGSA